jgi:hypothetical protein
MRVVVKEYAQGGRGAFETSNDGGIAIGEWAGPQKVGERISAFINVACEDNEEGVERLLASLAWLTEEIKKRKGSAAMQENAPEKAAGS